MQRFTELRVWQRSFQLTLDVYAATSGFPEQERYGLTAQVRRAVVSVAANIAEGAKRETNREYARFLNVAQGSLAETECLLRIAMALALGADTLAPLIAEAEEIARMLHALRRAVKRTIKRTKSPPPVAIQHDSL